MLFQKKKNAKALTTVDSSDTIIVVHAGNWCKNNPSKYKRMKALETTTILICYGDLVECHNKDDYNYLSSKQQAI